MKLIKRGVPPAERIWRGKCNMCNSEYEAIQGEIVAKLDEGHQDMKDHLRIVQAKCEVCSRQFILYPAEDNKKK